MKKKTNTTVKICFQQSLYLGVLDIENMPKTHSALKKWVIKKVKKMNI